MIVVGDGGNAGTISNYAPCRPNNNDWDDRHQHPQEQYEPPKQQSKRPILILLLMAAFATMTRIISVGVGCGLELALDRDCFHSAPSPYRSIECTSFSLISLNSSNSSSSSNDNFLEPPYALNTNNAVGQGTGTDFGRTRALQNAREPSSNGSPTGQHRYRPRCDDSTTQSPTEHDYEAPEPFRYLHDCCDDCNPAVPESPDPLVSMTWKFDQNADDESGNRPMQALRSRKPLNYHTTPNTDNFVGQPLQIYRTHIPVALYTIPSNASVVVNTQEDDHPRLIILEDCTVVMDWGSERAAWFEILSKQNLTDGNDDFQVKASVSEYNRPYPGKTRTLTSYGTHTYRLETNDELYEGVRFTFLHVRVRSNQSSPPLAIDDFSIVSKVKPLDYTGRFRSSHRLLTKAWYWGAYGVRLNVEQNQLNSILIERGDRVAIQGDGHPTIATMLAVFYGDETQHLLRNVLNSTDNAHQHVVDQAIMAYPLYWCLSAMDYYWTTYTGGSETSDIFVDQLVDDIALLLDKRIDDFLDPNLDITWFGWDDRVGNGWCFHSKQDACTREGLLAFAGLVIRVCNDFVAVLESLQDTGTDTARIQKMIQTYQAHSETMTKALRAVPEFPRGFGVHAAANAINARIATPSEIEDSWRGTSTDSNTLNNAVTICSFSQFNQYWILQAFGNMENGLEHALKSIELCWGPMMELSTGGCFWEMSSREWLSFLAEGDQAPHLPSYCHPWASGVTPWLSKMLGGVLPLAPGYQTFVAMPYVSANYPSVTTTTPTPHGPIVVEARLVPRTHRFNCDYDFEATIDSNVSGVVGVRKTIVMQQQRSSDEITLEAPLDVATLEVNGIPVSPHRIIDGSDVRATLLFRGSSIGSGHPRTREFLFLTLGGEKDDDIDSDDIGGSFVVTATYQMDPTIVINDVAATKRHRGLSNSTSIAAIDVSPFPDPVYPSAIREPFDDTSQGNGLLLYGKDGYALLGCNLEDRLPSYISNVTIRQHGYPGWVAPEERLVGYSDSDPIYLPLPGATKDAPKKRVLGTVGIDDQGGGDINCILVDARLATSWPHDSSYYLSIYFVAERAENRHAIRVMDGDTFDVIAPTTLIEDYQGGLWWTLHTNRSVRLKMMDIEGIHISAIAFSTDLSPLR